MIDIIFIMTTFIWTKLRPYLCKPLGHRFWQVEFPDEIITLDHCAHCGQMAEFAKRRLRDT